MKDCAEFLNPKSISKRALVFFSGEVFLIVSLHCKREGLIYLPSLIAWCKVLCISPKEHSGVLPDGGRQQAGWARPRPWWEAAGRMDKVSAPLL